MPALPSTVTMVPVGPGINAGPLDSDYSQLAVAVNAFIALLSGGSAATPFLTGNGATLAFAAGQGEVQLYDNIAGGAIASWDVPSILQTYAHLRFVIQARGDTAATSTGLFLRFNGDSGANYDYQWQSGASTVSGAAQSAAGTSVYLGDCSAASAPAGSAGTYEVRVTNYAAVVFHKQVLVLSGQRSDTAAFGVLQVFGNWRNTGAVNRIQVFPAAGNLIAGSRLTIYGQA